MSFQLHPSRMQWSHSKTPE